MEIVKHLMKTAGCDIARPVVWEDGSLIKGAPSYPIEGEGDLGPMCLLSMGLSWPLMCSEVLGPFK